MLESLFNKVAGLQAFNFIRKRLQHRLFPVNVTRFLRTPILEIICERLLLQIVVISLTIVYRAMHLLNLMRR